MNEYWWLVVVIGGELIAGGLVLGGKGSGVWEARRTGWQRSWARRVQPVAAGADQDTGKLPPGTAPGWVPEFLRRDGPFGNATGNVTGNREGQNQLRDDRIAKPVAERQSSVITVRCGRSCARVVSPRTSNELVAFQGARRA